MRAPLLTITCLVSAVVLGQKQPAFTSADTRLGEYEDRIALGEASIINGIAFRSIGPTVMSGRVVDLAVDPNDPTHFYVAYASGGLWETTNNGTSFEPIFDNEVVMTIGDIAVNWKTKTIWVGTGENNSSRSSYSGVGMFKSTDNGATWEHMGLEESHHIGRIILHPTDPNTIWVGVLGHLYSPNEDRGVYKTTDGGVSWVKTLYVDDNSGAIDMVIDPNDPNVLYAATWERERRAWNFVESGKGTGIYRSADGGETWELITGNDDFPSGDGAGRIGLDIANDGTLYACIDNQNRRPAEEDEVSTGLQKDELRTMSKEDFLALDNDLIDDYLSSNYFEDKYSAEKVKKMVKRDEILPVALVEYTEDANSLLFDTPVIGQEVYVTKDAGATWSKTHEGYLDDVVYSYGYYFGQVRVDPNNSDMVYIMGVPILRSADGGANWESISGANVHADHHALWVNPDDAGHLINGNDGGLNISYDNGDTWIKCNSPTVGQFYAIAVDMDTPYNVYGGLQDNGVWVGPSTYEWSDGWHQSGDYPYEFLLGGDGMQAEIDPRDNNTVYTGSQFGYYYRVDKTTGRSTYISPSHELGERPLRFNWQTPIQLSEHNYDILYMGANKLYRSMDQGDSWEAISEDLTYGGKKGDVPYGTLATIHESSLKFGLIYTGSDDGRVHVTKDGGNNWTEITGKLPKNMWVSRVQASSHEQDRVYVSLNGYRWDDFSAYLYVSNDYGTTWERIGTDLPAEPINVVREDPVDPNIIYVGTDHGLYVSLNGGESFMHWSNGLPATPIHDLVIHPRDHDIVVGTHGRSIYVASVRHIREIDLDGEGTLTVISDHEPVPYGGYWGSTWSRWFDAYEPEVSIAYISDVARTIVVTVTTEDGVPVNSFTQQAMPGINYASYNMEVAPDMVDDFVAAQLEADAMVPEEAGNGKYYLVPGTYQVSISFELDNERFGILTELTISED